MKLESNRYSGNQICEPITICKAAAILYFLDLHSNGQTQLLSRTPLGDVKHYAGNILDRPLHPLTQEEQKKKSPTGICEACS
jgi:hypothetical protein